MIRSHAFGPRVLPLFTLAPAIALVSAAFLTVDSARAQQPSPNVAVQLPTIGSFNINTTVSVPDGGTLYLGSIGGAALESTPRRGSRAVGRSIGGPGVSVSATLIIGSEVDAELERRGRIALAKKARPEIHGTQAEKARARFLAEHLGRGWK